MTKTTLTLLALALLMCIGVARADSVNLTWTAPGDDDRVGTATLYDLRYSQAPINDYNWDDATRVTGVLAPRPSGTPESHTVDGLASGQTYYFALRTADEALNWSTLSNVVAKSIVPESIAPSSIADFSSVSSTQTSITLTWSAPGDDGQDGTASEYDLRCAEFAISESNWNSAARVSGVSAPASAGSAETFTCTGLNPSTQYHYAIKTSDEVPNWSGISNLVTASTASENVNLPPAEIADLQELDATISSVSLTWTAPGSEGNVGTATQYDLRYATVPIDESNWTSSTVLEDLAAPQTAGSVESCVISGLEAATTYYFALKTADEVPQWSGLSNIAAARTTSDISYPLEITDLAGTGHAMTSVSLAWTAPGAADGSASAVEYDLRFANYEITPSNWATANRVRTIGAPNTAGTSEALTVGALTPNIKYYFAIKAADQSTNWSAMSNVITRTTGAETTAPSDIADLEGTETTETSVTLSWTAPGDDGVNGTASAYDLRCAEFAINESNWNSATHVSGVPSPVGAGGAETFTCTGLNPGTRYYFAIKASDEVSNWSGVSNLVTANTVPEVVNLPPSAIADLIGTDVTTSSVSLSWTAPGADDTKGTASQYDLRYATSPIGESNWNSATVLEGLTLPQPAGSVETYTISGLDPDTDYYFAVKTADEVPQWSGLSNIVQVQTSAEASYPLEITDLAGTGHTTTSVSLAWTAPGAEDGSQSAVEYDLRFANYEIAESNWASANRVRTIGAPKPAGTDEAFTVGALTPNITYYFAIKAADQSGDWSAMSNVVSRRTGSEIVAPSDITDLEGVEATETSVTLSWTAPGDNGISGTASEYDLRYAVETITAANWNTIARLEGLAAPLEAGSVETYTISGLEPGREHFFAVRTADEVPNWSGISNVVSVQTSVVNLPPGIISNLAATEVTTSSATLTWSATGADGEIGTATTYDLGCATEPITESNWGVVTHIAGLPSPSASGNAEIFTVNALEPETQYYFAVKACDEIAQWSALSNVVDLITKAENQPPVAIASLAAEQITARTLTLTWTAPADDGPTGAASQYDLRYSLSPLTEDNWAVAGIVADVSAPGPVGSQQSHLVGALTPDTHYYFAVRAADDAGLWSALSNVVAVKTEIEIVAGDEPPADIIDLVSTGKSATTVSLAWTAPGADGTEGTASEYDLRFANYPIDENNWTTANKVRPLPTPQPSGTRQERTVSALTPGITYFFAIKTADNLPSWSDISNVVTAFTGESTPTLTVDFASSTLSGAAPLEVSFSSDVSGEPTSWLWDFGDGSQSLEENPTHVYDASGSFTVTLTVASGSVSASETKADYIVVIEPEQEDALHVSRLVTSRKQYKIWCRGYADVYVVNSLGQPVEGATVALAASGATSEALSAVTDGLGVASFKTRVSRNCSKDWCFAVTDVSHPQLPYDAPSDVVNSTCYTVATYAGRAEFDWDGVEMPIDFSLEQNYPNPFNPSTEITYSLPAPSQVRLVVINMLGQEVVTLVEGQQSAGWHSTTWDGRSAGGKAVASGLYFYHLQAGEFSESRKMMLLK